VARNLFKTKSLDDIMRAAGNPEHGLRRVLGPGHITLLGIGAIIGAGIFATVGSAAAGDLARPGAGPSLMLSFGITAVVCAFTALCYAELASMVPIAGSAYTYSYATLGEVIAWIIGWDLIIEYAVGNIAVAISWANYFRTFLQDAFHWDFPQWLAIDYRTAAKLDAAREAALAAGENVLYPSILANAPHIGGVPIVFNLLGVLIVAAITIVLVRGVRESARFNAGMVIIKLIVLAFFVAVAFYFMSPSKMAANWHPFQPNGWKGTFAGAAIVFFAYIGFDAVSTVAEETRNPGRDLPIGIIASLLICTVIYVVVAAVFTGLISYPELIQRLEHEKAEPLTMALQHVAPQAKWASAIVAFGSVVAHTAVLLVFQMGQPRIFFAMARDGLLPATFAKVHPRFRTPHITTILTGLFVGGAAAVANLDEMVDLTNIGTLFAFALVCIGVIVLRYTDPHRTRPFRVPGPAWLLPGLGAVSCVGLMYYLPGTSWWRFFGWLLLGLAVYAAFGYCHSTVGRDTGRPVQLPASLKLAAVGFLLIAVGLFTIPHHSTPRELVHAVATAGDILHGRSLTGAIFAAVGLALVAVCSPFGFRRSEPAPRR
jgi:APA family basic amino acid/polyamine antiporter